MSKDSNDLVERLRADALYAAMAGQEECAELSDDAADEIERLRTDLAFATAGILAIDKGMTTTEREGMARALIKKVKEGKL